jgi:hypothetical protein
LIRHLLMLAHGADTDQARAERFWLFSWTNRCAGAALARMVA